MEIVVSIGIASLITLAIGNLAVSGYRFSQIAGEEADALYEAERAIQTLSREIRELRTGEDGSYPLMRADDYAVTFFSDIDDDNLTEKITYEVFGAELRKTVIKPSGSPSKYKDEDAAITTVAQYIRNTTPLFIYYNGDWPGDEVNNPLPTPTRLQETKLMRVHLEINVNPNRIPKTVVVSTAAQLRNLKTNI